MTHDEASRKGWLTNGSEPVAYFFRFVVLNGEVKGMYWQLKSEAAPKRTPTFFKKGL